MKLNLPNILSIIRILIAPIFLIYLITDGMQAIYIACILYFVASITDYFDGWLARKFNSISNWGKFLDPLADKFLTTAAFLGFVINEIVPLWMVIIIIIRDFGTTFLRLYAEKMNKHLKTSLFAKWKTTFQMFFIAYILVLLLFEKSIGFTFYILQTKPQEIHNLIYSNSIMLMMLILTLITIWTAVEYVKDNQSILRNSEKNANT